MEVERLGVEVDRPRHVVGLETDERLVGVALRGDLRDRGEATLHPEADADEGEGDADDAADSSC